MYVCICARVSGAESGGRSGGEGGECVVFEVTLDTEGEINLSPLLELNDTPRMVVWKKFTNKINFLSEKEFF